MRGAYLLMAPAAWFVLVPLAHASLLSGIVLSLGTTWGLFRYYWVVLKLGMTVFATVILLIYMGTFRQMAGVAADPVVDLAAVRNASPIVHAILALVLLVAATVLGVYKPFGMTAYGERRLRGTAASGLGAHARKCWDSACTRRWQHTGLDLRGWRRRARSRAARRHPAPDRRHSDTPLGCGSQFDRDNGTACRSPLGLTRRLGSSILRSVPIAYQASVSGPLGGGTPRRERRRVRRLVGDAGSAHGLLR